MPWAKRVRFNPANPTESIVLWSNGYLEPRGGAAVPDFTTRFTNPPDVAVDLCVFNWATPSGWVLDAWGGIHVFGGATPPDPGAVDAPPYFPGFSVVRAFAPNPAGDGSGYVLVGNGDIYNFGGAPNTIANIGYGFDIARDIHVRWSDKRTWVLDGFGAITVKNGATATAQTFYERGWDIARALVVTDETNGKGYVLDGKGGIHGFGGNAGAPGGPYWADFAPAMDLAIPSTSPLTLKLLDSQGALWDWVSSTAPTVTVVGPADEGAGAGNQVVTTSRPQTLWTYDDAEGDGQAAWEVAWFTAAQYGVGGFDPATSPATDRVTGYDAGAGYTGNDGRRYPPALIGRVFSARRNARGEYPTVDLANGVTYRTYVRAQDTSGLWSAWAYRQFDTTLALPATPGLTATADNTNGRVALAVTLGAGGALGASERLTVEWTDTPANPASWQPVRYATELTAIGTVYDYELADDRTRSYRARRYTASPYLSSAASATVTATLAARQWRLHNPANPAQNVRLKVRPGVRVRTPEPRSVVRPIGRFSAVVVTGGPVSAELRLGLWALTQADYAALTAVLDSAQTLWLRDPYGRAWYVRPGDRELELLRATKVTGEAFPTRHAHGIDALEFVEVGAPTAGTTVASPASDFYAG